MAQRRRLLHRVVHDQSQDVGKGVAHWLHQHVVLQGDRAVSDRAVSDRAVSDALQWRARENALQGLQGLQGRLAERPSKTSEALLVSRARHRIALQTSLTKLKPMVVVAEDAGTQKSDA